MARILKNPLRQNAQSLAANLMGGQESEKGESRFPLRSYLGRLVESFTQHASSTFLCAGYCVCCVSIPVNPMITVFMNLLVQWGQRIQRKSTDGGR